MLSIESLHAGSSPALSAEPEQLKNKPV